ncbi:hypothetical protein L6218_12030 [Pseudomonas syringae pv. syringae]|uniref:hypothetical protein n=1 Tax=Pseudomonas TaxID=286 RepID=UPI0006B9D05D|nr:hypothetical protein [Pseudomonas syringae]KPB29754.1 Prophage PssSM-03 [Pseudomonas syringae pv. syringae]MCF5550385.1 hypothetical protein [Pseudomonas syringae]MCH5498812.1 hypothetical protein [Pseudomonas syringae pv. syringae]MCH5525161.1 hypothetical protein [Pseudomonas syringae pv. syringae]MCH5560187.1 hypothetical protein [Pseudomonas syringae pv. syringae]
MISPELSMIQRNKERSTVLEAKVADFIKRGGVIETQKGFPLKPKSKEYGRMSAPVARQPLPRRRTKEAMRAATPQDSIQDRCNARAEQVEVIRKLAETMTITDVMRKTDVSIYRLRKMARVHGFEYKAFSPASNLIPYQTDPVADAVNVVRIKAARDRGISRKAAVVELGLSNTMIKRLILDYSIDYPLQRQSEK